MRRPPAGWPTWKTPQRYGYGEAVQSAGMVVAPLLAGFSISLTVLVIDRADMIRWPDVVLMLLAGAVLALLASIQCAYSARQYLVRPDEIEAWFPGLSDPSDVLEWAAVRSEQFGHAALHKRWAGRFRIAYHAGIVLILGALVAILVPPGDVGVFRGGAIAVAGLAVMGEGFWIAATGLSYRWGPTDPPDPGVVRRAVRLIVPPYRTITPPDLVPPPDGSTHRAQRMRGSRDLPGVAAEAVVVLLVLGLVFVAAFAGWEVGGHSSRTGGTLFWIVFAAIIVVAALFGITMSLLLRSRPDE